MKNLFTWKNLGWVFTAVVTLMLGMTAIGKLSNSEDLVKSFEMMKLLPYMKWIGIAEFLGIGLLVYPRTSIYGAVLISSLMSGAVSLHLALMGGASLMVPIMLGVLAWSAHCLRAYTK
jgi:hypothetical protein